MSNIIKILPTNIANQIAAGEVVSRPSSVVKELMENSIDASSTNIQLIIKDAGRTLIQVIDNGNGMSEDDAVLSFQRHATSKISSSQDLLSLRTMGFRGEALAAISSISQIEMKTKQEGMEMGICLEVEAGEIKNKKIVACEKGCSISVKNLFFNTPARRNFLKADTTENNHILSEFLHLAIIHHDIAFTYINNGKIIHKIEKQSLQKRIIDIYGKNYREKLLPISEEIDVVKISGFIVKAQYAKRDKDDQFFFVNNRFMRSAYLSNSVYRAYSDLMPQGCYPSFFINLEVDPKNIDVNIHPTKTEVRFLDEKIIYAVLNAAVKKSLGQFSLNTQIDFEADSKFYAPPLKMGQIPIKPFINFDASYNPFNNDNNNSNKTFSNNKTNGVSLFSLDDNTNRNNSYQNNDIIQLHNKYIVSKTKNSLIIINQERASQRILFDKFIKNQYSDISSQQLLFPYNHFFSPTQTSLLLNLISEIRKYGFILEYNKNGSFDIKGVPNDLSAEETKEALEDILIDMQDASTENQTLNPKSIRIALSMSKHLSLKNGKSLLQEEMLGLVGQLFACQNCEISPFGKKILYRVEIETIDKIFD